MQHSKAHAHAASLALGSCVQCATGNACTGECVAGACTRILVSERERERGGLVNAPRGSRCAEVRVCTAGSSLVCPVESLGNRNQVNVGLSCAWFCSSEAPRIIFCIKKTFRNVCWTGARVGISRHVGRTPHAVPTQYPRSPQEKVECSNHF